MEILKMAVVGAGIMGQGIAQVVSAAGITVSLVDLNEEILQKAKSAIRISLDRSVQKNRITVEERDEIIRRILYHTDLAEAVRDVDLVTEAVPENLALKKDIFQRLDKLTKSEAILATNTSQYSITEIASAVSRKTKVVGTHWFNPPTAMKLIEIVRGQETSEKVIAELRQFAVKVGKEVIICNDSPGFVTTRALLALRLECYRIMEEGIASKEDIDKALKLGLGHPMGQFELADFSGLDIEPPSLQALTKAFGERFKAPQSLLDLVNAGKFGRKTGKGWYEYH